MMEIQERILHFVKRSNVILFFVASILGSMLGTPYFAGGIICGGLIVTINFHLLAKTIFKTFANKHGSHNVVLVKYYLRLLVSGIILFVLISKHIVDPLGLFIGLSIVVVSITMATVVEVKKLIFKEAV